MANRSGHDERSHHVVADLTGPIRLEFANGNKSWGKVDLARSAPKADVVCLEAEDPAPGLLPCASQVRAGTGIWTTGYHRPSEVTVAAVPTTGRIGGMVRIGFAGPAYYLIPALTLESATIRPGLSGAPIIDQETGVVVGMVGCSKS